MNVVKSEGPAILLWFFGLYNDFCCSLIVLLELSALAQLSQPQVIVDTSLHRNELLVGALFCDLPVPQYDDQI